MELAAKAQARKLRYVDAPVTGLAESAAAGTLTLLSAPTQQTWSPLARY
jgi:3-hydroxyisobutyrate dehydrogenase-like beta-hydroxyacid dehydrogenase